MKSARDMFNDRLSDDKARRGENLAWDERGAWELYRCGWEDGLRNHTEEQAQNSNEDIDAMVMRVAGEIADYCIPTDGGRMTIKAPGLAALKRALLTDLRAENARLTDAARGCVDRARPYEDESGVIKISLGDFVRLKSTLSSQASEANGESGEETDIDEDALRAEAEKAFDQYREGKNRSFGDICPKYGQGDTALMACGFIDGYTTASRALLVRKPAEEQKL